MDAHKFSRHEQVHMLLINVLGFRSDGHFLHQISAILVGLRHGANGLLFTIKVLDI